MRSKENLTTLCGLSREETELDFSSQDLGAGDAVLIANDISDMGALTSLNLASNSIGAYKDKEHPFKFHATPEGKAFVLGLCRWPNALLLSIGPAAIADAIKYMGALSTLCLKDNKLATKEAGKALAAALAGNSVLTELDVSNNSWYNEGDKDDGVGFAQELAAGIKDNGAISKFTFSGDCSDSKSVTMETTMTVADFTGKGLGVSEAVMLSAFLPKCT
jgi:hypothetical protein